MTTMPDIAGAERRAGVRIVLLNVSYIHTFKILNTQNKAF